MTVYSMGFQRGELLLSKGVVTSKGFTYSTDARCDKGYSGGAIISASTSEVIGVIKGSIGEVILVTDFIPCLLIYGEINNFNTTATVQIPNLDQYNLN